MLKFLMERFGLLLCSVHRQLANAVFDPDQGRWFLQERETSSAPSFRCECELWLGLWSIHGQKMFTQVKPLAVDMLTLSNIIFSLFVFFCKLRLHSFEHTHYPSNPFLWSHLLIVPKQLTAITLGSLTKCTCPVVVMVLGVRGLRPLNYTLLSQSFSQSSYRLSAPSPNISSCLQYCTNIAYRYVYNDYVRLDKGWVQKYQRDTLSMIY